MPLTGWFQTGAVASDEPIQRIGEAIQQTLPDARALSLGSQGIIVCDAPAAQTCEDNTLCLAIIGAPLVGDQPITASDTPADTLAERFRSNPGATLDTINGAFALAVLDKASGSLTLAIDRLGIEAMYYLELADGILFADSADRLRSALETAPDLDPQGIFNYLYFHMIPSPGTIYQGIRKLLPAQQLTASRDAVVVNFYWEARYTDHNASDEQGLSTQLLQGLEDSVRRSSIADVTGCFLSGGTDSSAVAGMLARVSTTRPKCFSIGFDVPEFDESEYAEAAARHFDLELIQYKVTPQDVLDAIPVAARHYSEPFGNASAIPTYYCAKLARSNGITHLLAGDGGDELFAGNARYAKQVLFDYYHQVPKFLQKGFLDPLAAVGRRAEFITPLRKLSRYVEQARLPMPERMETYNFLNRMPLEEIFESSFLGSVDTHSPLLNQQEVYERTSSRHILNRMMHLDLKITLADNDLRKVTGMCEEAGVSVSFPMLDRQFVEFSATLPPALQLRRLRLRDFYKRSMVGFLPEKILNKPKHGFGLPFGEWIKTYAPLREFAHDNLDAFSRRGIIKPGYLQQLRKSHQQEHSSYYGVMIWVLMMLEQWLQQHSL